MPGVYGRGADFEDVRAARSTTLRHARGAAGRAPSALRFPPVLPRRQLETIGYLKSFPHLAGSVFAFEGDEAQALEQDERAEPRTRTGASSSA